MPERMVGLFGRNDEISANEASQRARAVACERRVEAHRTPLVRNVELPAHPSDREPLSHQEPVAYLRTGRRIGGPRGAVDNPQDAFAAAVGDLEEQGAIAAIRFLWPKQIEIGGELDLSRTIPGRLFQVDDLLVVGIVWPDLEMNARNDLLVRASEPQRFAYQQIGAR